MVAVVFWYGGDTFCAETHNSVRQGEGGKKVREKGGAEIKKIKIVSELLESGDLHKHVLKSGKNQDFSDF